MKLSEEKIFKFGFYCLKAFICIYSLYMFVIQNGTSNELELLFCSTFIVDILMYYLKRKNNILKWVKMRNKICILSILRLV